MWVTGSYDPDSNLTYWGIGNPGPDWNADMRLGDNLYTDCVVALDADTGKLKWYFQFTPHDDFDFDSVQVPVLADLDWKGARRRVMLWANRNGFFYVLDRTTGEFLQGAPFAKVTWAKGLDERGRPMRAANMVPTAAGTLIYPGNQGGTNWYSPSYSPHTGLFYIPTWDNYYSVYVKEKVDFAEGRSVHRAAAQVSGALIRPPQIVNRAEEDGYGAIRAFDPQTGDRKWEYKMTDVTDSGILTTASRSVVCGRTRRLLHGDGCAQRRVTLEGSGGRPGFGGADELFGKWQAVCRYLGGKFSLRLWIEAVSCELEIDPVLALLLAPLAGTAQWLNYPAAGRAAWGRWQSDPRRSGAATADGKPDLSGVWSPDNLSYLTYLGADGTPMPMRPWANAVLLHRQATKGKEDPDANCTLPGVPRIDSVPNPFKILQSPDEVVILYEAFTTFRQVFLDGRALPEDPQPAWMGYSVGKWDGDSLVVDTAGFNDGTWLDNAGTPHSEALHVTERFHRRDIGHLDIQITVDDPENFSASIHGHRTRAPASRHHFARVHLQRK